MLLMMMFVRILLSISGVAGAAALHHLRAGLRKNGYVMETGVLEAPTFPGYVETVTSGRGIWKWNNALVAYDRHMARFKQQPVKLGEVGVWSGGSLLMWHAVLGSRCHVYGMDIAENAYRFQDKNTTISMVDQGDPAAWTSFFKKVTPTLDVLVDDGAHASITMLTTSTSAWPHLSPGGVLAIEDINGAYHLDGFLLPVAKFYGGQGTTVASIHMYPLVLIAEKAPVPIVLLYDPSVAPGAVVKRVAQWSQVAAAIAAAPAGSTVVLENAAWGATFLSEASLSGIFQYFIGLYAPAKVVDQPVGCAATNKAQCTYSLVNSAQQDKITAVHVLPSKMVVEIAASKPVIQAVRHGTEWVSYPKR